MLKAHKNYLHMNKKVNMVVATGQKKNIRGVVKKFYEDAVGHKVSLTDTFQTLALTPEQFVKLSDCLDKFYHVELGSTAKLTVEEVADLCYTTKRREVVADMHYNCIAYNIEAHELFREESSASIH